MKKALVIRFSSFGDIVQASSVIEILKHSGYAQVDWLTKKEFAHLVALNQGLGEVISFDKKNGLFSLIKLTFKLIARNYDLVYDAHNNLRTLLIKLLFALSFRPVKVVVRSKERWKRFLLFKLRINQFPKPYVGVDSFYFPLQKKLNFNVPSDLASMSYWDFKSQDVKFVLNFINEHQLIQQKYIALIPSAAWEMKRWPNEHWKEFLKQALCHPKLQEMKYIFLGGPEDLYIGLLLNELSLESIELKNEINARVVNAAGKLSLTQSSYLLKEAKSFISGDTGLLHVADRLGVPGIAIQGPTAFGFTKSSSIKTMEVDLACRPCTKDGRGRCSNEIFKACLVQIHPQSILQELLLKI